MCVNNRGNCVSVFAYVLSGADKIFRASDCEFVPTSSFILSDELMEDAL